MADNNQMKMDESMGTVKARTLTLEPEKEQTSFIFTEPEPTRAELTETWDDGADYAAGTINESMLSAEEKAQVEEFAGTVDISNEKQLSSFGASAQTGIAGFSSAITTKIKAKEFGEVGEDLLSLGAEIRSIEETPRKGLLGLFQKGKAKVQYFVSKYETAETNIRKIEKILKRHLQTLTKDIMVYEEMYNMNLQYYKEITMYIIAGKKALSKARATTLVELHNHAEMTQDQMDIQKAKDYEDSCTRFEKKLYDLELSRMISIQNAPQIRMLQNVERELVDRIQADILHTIPLWRNQMVLTLGITHVRKALDAQTALTEMTNEMLKKNSETLKQGAIETAVASECGIVDIETIRKCNADILSSINEVVKIHEEGTKKRAEAIEELAKIEEEFKQGLLEAAQNRYR